MDKRAVEHYESGIRLIKQGNLEQALIELRQAIEIAPDFTHAHYNLGNAFLLKEEYEDAVQAYREAIRLDPDIGQVRINLGKALAFTGRLSEAITEFHLAQRTSPDDADLYEFGHTLTKQGQVHGGAFGAPDHTHGLEQGHALGQFPVDLYDLVPGLNPGLIGRSVFDGGNHGQDIVFQGDFDTHAGEGAAGLGVAGLAADRDVAAAKPFGNRLQDRRRRADQQFASRRAVRGRVGTNLARERPALGRQIVHFPVASD